MTAVVVRDETVRPVGADRVYGWYLRLLGPLLAGYLLFDKAFAYLRPPGSPAYIGEIVLVVGCLGGLLALGRMRAPSRDTDPVLALLGAFVVWGAIGLVPGLAEYGLDAVRDSAIWYYGIFAVCTYYALVRHPDRFEVWARQLDRFIPWLLAWLPFAVLLAPREDSMPSVPFSETSIVSHKSGDAAIAAVLALAFLWLFPRYRGARSRALWSVVALGTIGLCATQNRGGAVAAAVGACVGLMFMPNRARLVGRALAVLVVGLGVGLMVQPSDPYAGTNGRSFSASQLIENAGSLGGGESTGDLDGTVRGREELWTRVLDLQVRSEHLVEGLGFGQNLAREVGLFQSPTEKLRSPHNSHLDILARMGLLGLSLWLVMLAGWYLRVGAACRRLEREGRRAARQTAVLCMVVVSAVLVNCFFDPGLEGPQVAVLLWTMLGVGLAVIRPPAAARGGPG